MRHPLPQVRALTSDLLLGSWMLRTRNAQSVSVPEEHHPLRLSFRALSGLYPMTHACTGPNALQEADRAISGVGAIMTSHDGFDCLRSLVSVVEGDGRDVVMEHVSLDNPMHKRATDKTKFAVNRSRGAPSVTPCLCCVVRKSRVGVLQEGYSDCDQGRLG